MVAAVLYEPFPLWQAEQARPELAGTPTVVAQGDRVMHASATARRLGIEVGMSLTAAQFRAASLEIIRYDGLLLQGAWEACLEELYGLTPWLESLDTGRVLAKLEPADARQLAAAYRTRVGMAFSREVALIAALTAFNSSLRVVEPGLETRFLASVPIRFLRGLGLSFEAVHRLSWLGVLQLGDIMSWRYPQLEAYLGPEARPLKLYLYGPWREDVSLYRPPPLCSASYDFADEASEPYEVMPVLAMLAKGVAKELEGRVASRLKVKAVSGGVTFPASRLAKKPLRTTAEITRLAEVALLDTKALPLGITTLELELSGLFRPAYQSSLWDAREGKARAVEMVNARFPGAIYTLRLRDPYSLAPELTYERAAMAREEGKDAPAAQPDSRGHGRGRKAAQPVLRR